MNANLFPESSEPRVRKLQGPQADACRAWHEAWARHRGCAFAWTAKDAALVAQALKLAGGDVARLAARIERLLSEAEDQWLARNAGPGVLVSHWNQLAYQPPPKPSSRLPRYEPLRTVQEHEAWYAAARARFAKLAQGGRTQAT